MAHIYRYVGLSYLHWAHEGTCRQPESDHGTFYFAQSVAFMVDLERLNFNSPYNFTFMDEVERAYVGSPYSNSVGGVYPCERYEGEWDTVEVLTPWQSQYEPTLFTLPSPDVPTPGQGRLDWARLS
jgi:hypothetical protein